jgi:hypothetical protein
MENLRNSYKTVVGIVARSKQTGGLLRKCEDFNSL